MPSLKGSGGVFIPVSTRGLPPRDRTKAASAAALGGNNLRVAASLLYCAYIMRARRLGVLLH
jgi:hypothetical protein